MCFCIKAQLHNKPGNNVGHFIWFSPFGIKTYAKFSVPCNTASIVEKTKKQKKTLWPLFTTKFPDIPGTPQKDERLSQPWSHPVVLNTGPLDWESSTGPKMVFFGLGPTLNTLISTKVGQIHLKLILTYTQLPNPHIKANRY